MSKQAKTLYRGLLTLGADDVSGLRTSLESTLAIVHSREPAGEPQAVQAPAMAGWVRKERLVIDFGDHGELVKRGAGAIKALESDAASGWKRLASRGIYRGRGEPGNLAESLPRQASRCGA